MKQILLVAAFSAATVGTCSAQNFVDLAHAFDGGTGLKTDSYVGQSFTAGANANNITFNFYNGSDGPNAAGLGYLFSSAYTGTPDGLSTSDAGFLGLGKADFGKYYFDPSLTLQEGVKYFFYSNFNFAAGEIYGGYGAANGNLFYTTPADGVFMSGDGLYLNYQVDGLTVTPEPSAFLLLGSGLLGGVGMLRRKLVG